LFLMCAKNAFWGMLPPIGFMQASLLIHGSDCNSGKAELKKQIGQPAVKPPAEPKASSADQPEGKDGWFISMGIAGMRKRLGLTRAQMANLCGVTVSAVCLWENANTGKLRLRTKAREALAKLRKMTTAAAKKALAGQSL